MKRASARCEPCEAKNLNVSSPHRRRFCDGYQFGSKNAVKTVRDWKFGDVARALQDIAGNKGFGNDEYGPFEAKANFWAVNVKK